MKSQSTFLSVLVIAFVSTIAPTNAGETYPGEKSFTFETENMESLKGKTVRFVEQVETGPYQTLEAPTAEEAREHSKSFAEEDKANRTTYKEVSDELMQRLKTLPAARYLISNYKHSNGRDLDYLLFLPENYDESKTYPVFLSLHGTGESRVKDMFRVACNGVGPAAAALDHAQRFPCFIVVPRAKPGENWGYVKSRRNVAEDNWRASWRETNGDEVIGLLKELETRYSIDPLRRYVMGQSMGGLGALEMAVNRPGIFAAAVPIVGVPYSKDAPKLDCPTWLFTAELEGSIGRNISKVQCNVDFYKAAREAGKDVRLTMYCGYGHGSHQMVFYHPGLWEWLFSQRRSAE